MNETSQPTAIAGMGGGPQGINVFLPRNQSTRH